MPYEITGTFEVLRAMAPRGSQKLGATKSLQKILQAKANERQQGFLVMPQLVEVLATELAVVLGTPQVRGTSHVYLIASLLDAKNPLEEPAAREALKDFNNKGVVFFSYLACAWPSPTANNGSFGPGISISIAHGVGKRLSREVILETAEQIGTRLGGIRHFFLQAEPKAILQRM